MQLKLTNVDLGYLETAEAKKLHPRWFPSKAGGKPAWLTLEDLPTTEELVCKSCSHQTIFLVQIYAPDEPIIDAFHRTIYIFICRNKDCNDRTILAFRTQLPRINVYYPYNAPSATDDHFNVEEILYLCSVCGCDGTKQCSKCHKARYCTKEHQVVDWKNGHKRNCGETDLCFSSRKILYKEYEIKMETEEMVDKVKTTEEDELEIFREMVAEGRAGMIDNEGELNAYAATIDEDKTFAKFKERIEICPDQVIRYERHGTPLNISDVLPTEIPPCQYCQSPRTFEFQILPQILYELKEQHVDFGTLQVFTCSNSCVSDRMYLNEFVFKQDVI